MNSSPHLNREWLFNKYIVEGLSTYDIGALVSRDPKGIFVQLRRLSIPTRPRGQNLKGDDHWSRTLNGYNAFEGKKHSAETRAAMSVKASVPRPWLAGERNGMFGKRSPNYKGGVTPERQRVYSTPEWKALQREVFERDHYRCRRCCKVRRKRHAHHVRPWATCVEGRMDKDNLITLCATCHRWVHSKANVERLFIER